MTRGDVHDAATLEAWIADVLCHGSGLVDATLLCAVLRGHDPGAMADLARATAASAERVRETEEQGRALAETLSAMGEAALEPGPLPIVLGRAAGPLGARPTLVAALFLQAFAGSLVSAGVRAVPVGQAAGQEILATLRPLVLGLAEQAADTDPLDIATSAFGADMDAMAHETLDVRIFRS